MLLPGQITQEQADELNGPPSLLARVGEGLANAPSEFVNTSSRLLYNLGLADPTDEGVAGQIPKPYDIPAAKTWPETLVDLPVSLVPQIPFFLSGEGLAGEAAVALGLGKTATGIAKGAAGFGLIGESDEEPTPISSALMGAAIGAGERATRSLLKRKKLPLPQEQPPPALLPKQVDAVAPLKGVPPPIPAKSAAESAQVMIEADMADHAAASAEDAGTLLRKRLAFEESQNTAAEAPKAFPAPKSAEESANIIAHNFQEVDNLHTEARGDNAGAMLRQHLKNQEYVSRGMPPPGSLIEQPAVTEGEALAFSRRKRGVTAPEGSLVREPTMTPEELKRGRKKVATLQPIVGPVLTDEGGNMVLAEGKLGANHSDITATAVERSMDMDSEASLNFKHQFRDAKGNVLDREQAWNAAKANGQIKDALIEPTETAAKAAGKKPELHSQMLKSELAPKVETVKDIAPPPKKVPVAEVIRNKAIQYKGRIFEAESHPEATTKMRKAFPEAKTVKGLAEIRSGYMTSTGRFIGEKEASKLKGGPELYVPKKEAVVVKPKVTFELQDDVYKNIKEYAPAVKSKAGKVFQGKTHEEALTKMQQSSEFVDEHTEAKNGRGYINRKTGEFQTLMDIARERMEADKPKAKKVATLQQSVAETPPLLPEKGVRVMTTDAEGKAAEGEIVSHHADGTTKVLVDGEVLDKYTKDLMEGQGTAAGDLLQVGGMEAFEDLEKKTIARKSGLKLKQKLPEVGAAPAEVVSKIARYVALPTVAGAVGYATAEPDNRTATAIAFAIGAAGLGWATPKMLRRIAEANPEIARKGSVPRRIAEVTTKAKEIVTASDEAATKVARDQPSASGLDLMTLWMSRHFTTDAELIRVKDKAKGIINDLHMVAYKAQTALAQMTISPADRALMNEYFDGNVTAKFFLDHVSNDSVGRTAVGMRDTFTALSEIFYESLPEGELKNTVAAKADSYMTETFRMFHDPKHMPSEAVIDAAARDMGPDISVENGKAILRAYQHQVQVNRAAYGFNKQGASIGASFGDAVTKKDGKLKDSFRAFLGIYEDPIERAAATLDKLTRAATTAEHFNQIEASIKPNGLKWGYSKPQMDLAREGIEHDIAKAKGQGLQGEVATLQQKLEDLNAYQYNETNVQHGKFSDSFVDRRVHDALKTYDSMAVNSMSGVIRMMTDATNAIKYGKIILSPLQFARQIITMPIIGMMAKTHPGDWAKAAYSLLKDPVERARILRTGILQGDQITGMFKQDFSDIMSGKMSDTFAQTKVAKGLRTWEEAFRTPDLVIRVAAFQKEEARLLRLGKSAEEAEKGAVYFANRYTMNYGAVPPGIKVLRKIPFVNQYLTFAYEISRITKNLVEDIRFDDPNGVGRVHALTALGTLASAPFIIQKLTESQLSEKDLADWNKVKNLSPSYNRSDFKFVSGRDKNGNFHYVNFTPLLVHDRWQKMTVDIMKGDWSALAADNPIFGWENTPLLNVATNQITGKDIHTGKELDTFGARIASVRRDVMPPLLGTDLDKIVQALTPNAEGGLGVRNLQTGQGSSIGDILASYVTSIRGYTVNPDVLTRRAIVEAQQASANARGYYYQVARSNATLQQKAQALAEFQMHQKQIMMALRDKLRVNPALQSSAL